MQPEQIMSSDLLDILFADRNKTYGAYPLRREYNHRLKKALMITGALVCTVLAIYYYQGSADQQSVTSRIFEIPDTELKAIPDQPKPPAPPPPPQPRQRQIATRRFLTPVIVKDAAKHDPPPPIDEMVNSRVGDQDKAGIPDGGFPPPAVTGSGAAHETPPIITENDNAIVDKVDIESAYPGGPKAWKRFLIKTFKYPDEAEQNGIYGTVLIKFVVDREGNVSSIQALSGPEELRAEAIRVISKSGKWTRAIKNGDVVNSYKYQQIVFQISE